MVADDEHHLYSFTERGAPVGALRLFGGDLPEEPAARKAAKPDLECLAALPGGRLLALGSGSRPQRTRGALVDVAAERVQPVDCAELYAALGRELAELNLEGAAVRGEQLVLLQRGNGPSGVNAVIELALAGVLDGVAAGRLGGDLLRAVRPLEVGVLPGGQRLDFTDASPHGDKILFTAAAESSPDTYLDGPCAGSAIGILGQRVEALWQVAGAAKLEGVHAAGRRVWVVADGDVRGQPAPLYAGELP